MHHNNVDITNDDDNGIDDPVIRVKQIVLLGLGSMTIMMMVVMTMMVMIMMMMTMMMTTMAMMMQSQAATPASG